ncbi:DNA-binding transcriptional regulator [Commensalibacter communis]|uniref:MerR family (SoxR) n=2 Tax=Commensalibacter communis TaxID=2972786 RepID=A0A9W4TLI3_9PROT|nr:DNA-binding transcriptional regulator [Commensalibacter communis]CAI3923137.1 DNA-binding transcriptional regulator [Commensalibacter communis]CAI3924045.1 DNA-binding transcriptional regulator [Commensalibacter communis]CAI3935357.1 DNA-binding transcriptional regulator [Commensalibacter communis]CAI3939362.1 DNA-binding transcriptional regulator [Commensalibacter communis]
MMAIQHPEVTIRSIVKETKMKISELARQASCSVETIRYYEKEKLLPLPLREQANNYRYYDNTHLERLLFIRRCRALNMSHKEIKIILEACDVQNRDCGEINSVIQEHLVHVQNKIAKLKILEEELQHLNQRCHASGVVEKCGIVNKLKSL